MSKKVILVVDDEKIVLDSIKTEFRNEFGNEFRIEVAESGNEALEIIYECVSSETDVPIVISDHIMPGMMGDELLERIHRIIPDTLKIMLTGQANSTAVGNAVNKANLYRYISKPWDSRDLSLTIREAVKSYYQAQMVDKQNREIRELNQNLELKVEERTKELLEALAAKDKFFSIIAHDLKNPINIMMTSGELLLRKIDTADKTKIRDLVGKINIGVRRISNLLHDLLDWARSQTGQISYNPEKIDLKIITEENIDLLIQNAEAKEINLLSEIKEQIPAFADRNMISTVVRNLITNAIKFTRHKGNIVISASIEGNFSKISVKDDGVGMSEEIQKKLFRIDGQVSTKGTDSESGTGLGLIMCREFIEKNNGCLNVESEIEKGSSFTFTIPSNNI